MSAFASEYDIAQKGNIIIEFNPFAAFRARRGGPYNRFAQREAINTYVHKTSE
jgi:hypothetical protein